MKYLLILLVCFAGKTLALEFEHVMTFGSKGSGPGQFRYVEDFALAHNGTHLLVTDASHSWVQVFDKKTGKYITRFGGKGDEPQNLDKPEGVSVAPDGRIFVADYASGYVKIYDKNYRWLKTFSGYGTAPGETRKSEFSDIYDGRYYLPEAGNHRVSVWDLQGNFQFLFGGKGDGQGQMNNPEATKFSSDGKLYLSDLKNNRVQVFDAKGKFLFAWGQKGIGDGQFVANSGLALDRDDNVYVAEIGNNRIQVFNHQGKFLTKWGSKGSGEGQFGNLHGVFVDKSSGWVYVADTANNRVQVFRQK
ncbi:NHL repeat-containing protein [Dongshaea marina]|uniref:NHL repeat-containing protein n=1 Tax=Dongshaea marina TaxID=2047966 RepID=UPI000D3EA1D7|nr:NHL repeat-containing protein [Dongshaea marina]